MFQGQKWEPFYMDIKTQRQSSSTYCKLGKFVIAEEHKTGQVTSFARSGSVYLRAAVKHQSLRKLFPPDCGIHLRKHTQQQAFFA